MAKRKKGLSKGEKLLYFSGVLCFTLAIVIKIFFGASIGNYKMSNEKIRYEISSEQKTVESLNMQVSELTSFDNVSKVVKDLGLAYNNDNIVVIDPNNNPLTTVPSKTPNNNVVLSSLDELLFKKVNAAIIAPTIDIEITYIKNIKSFVNTISFLLIGLLTISNSVPSSIGVLNISTAMTEITAAINNINNDVE